MIFVTVGNDKHNFKRLLSRIELVSSEMYGTKFVVQAGHNNFHANKNVIAKNFFDKPNFYNYLEKAELIITHAGAGTLINIIKMNKKPIVVPRLEKYKEHLNDHQLEIAEEFEKNNFF